MAVELHHRTTGVGQAPALLVVDASVGFTDPQSPLGADFSTELARINLLLAHAREAEWPVFLSSVVYRAPDEARVFRQRLPDLDLLVAGSRWVELDARLVLTGIERVFEKLHASCFHGTDLDRWLRADSVDSVIVTGFTTSGCVRASAVDALQYGYQTVVAADAVGDRDADAHRSNLRDLGLKYADIMSVAEICAGRAGADLA